jgi:hypothetical protein
MKPIAMFLDSMLTSDATQQWTGQTSAVASHHGWGWGGVFTP